MPGHVTADSWAILQVIYRLTNRYEIDTWTLLTTSSLLLIKNVRMKLIDQSKGDSQEELKKNLTSLIDSLSCLLDTSN